MQNPFHLPFPSRGISPHADIIAKQSAAWVQTFCPLDGFSEAQYGRTLLIGELLVRTHPTFRLDEQQLVADWIVWFFIRDDFIDQLPLECIQPHHDRFMAILNGQTIRKDNDPLSYGLADLWHRITPLVTDAWKRR